MDDPVQEIEILQGVRSLVLVVRTYFDECLEQGFTELQAMELTLSYQRSSIISNGPPSPED